MSKKPSQIAIDFPGDKPWFIRRPMVYRYLPVQYAEDFFENGRLRLSSFKEFSRHRDEERQDGEEGQGLIVRRDFDANNTLVAAGNFGENSYVLCGSINLSSEIASAFGTRSGFCIDDTLGFCSAISEELPGFKTGLEGLCIYSDRRLVIRDKEPMAFNFQQLSNMTKEELTRIALGLADNDLFFIKTDRYVHQNEYRMIWTVDHAVDVPVVITCPEARKFCTPFENLTLASSNQ